MRHVLEIIPGAKQRSTAETLGHWPVLD